MNKNTLPLLIKLSRPVLLLGGVGLMLLGAGIARYLGTTINWEVFWLGLVWIILVQLASQYLNEYFDIEVDSANENRTVFSGGSGAVGTGEDKLSRKTAFLSSSAPRRPKTSDAAPQMG